MDYTFILGIDVASKKLDLCLFEPKSKKRSFESIDYNEKCLKSFLTKFGDRVNSQNCLVGLESTGDYHLQAAKFFLSKNFTVKIINPILTNQYIKTTIRGTKTDKTDSELICKLLLDNHGDKLILDELTNGKKELLRLSTSLTKTATQLKLKLQSIKQKSINNTESVEKDIQQTISGLKQISEDLIEQASGEQTEDEEFIDSIPGFAIKLSAIVYYEIGDINCFPNSKKLIAFAGLDPRIKQSGNKLNTSGRITKRGSKYLRTALFLAANIARQHDSGLKEYYKKKKQEGRTHKEILCMISRKLLARIYTVLKERRNYIKK